jgi:hypothetical protein
MNSITYDIPDIYRKIPLSADFFTANDALVRLDDQARRSVHAPAWGGRLLFGEACAAQLLEGELVHVEDLLLLDGHAFSGAPSSALSSALTILKAWRAADAARPGAVLTAARPGLVADAGTGAPVVETLAPEFSSAALEAWRRVQAEARALPALLAAAVAWDAWLVLLPESRSAWRATLLAALTLKARGLTAHLLPPIDTGWRLSGYRREARHDFATRMEGFLACVEAAARDALMQLDSLTLAAGMLQTTVARRRSTSRMAPLVDLLLAHPFVSVRLVANRLGISRQAAHGLLKRIGAPVHKITDRQRDNVWGVTL